MQEPDERDTSTESAVSQAAAIAARRRLVGFGAAAALVVAGGIAVAVLPRQAPEVRAPAPISEPSGPAASPSSPSGQTGAPPGSPAGIAAGTSPRPGSAGQPEPAVRAAQAKSRETRPATRSAPSAPGTASAHSVPGSSLPSQPQTETVLARLKDPSGATVTFLREGTVRVSGTKLPPELSRDLYRLYVLERVPEPEATPPAGEEPPLRLTSPNPGDTGVESATPVFRWTAIPGVETYRLILERLSSAASAEWQSVEGMSGQSVAAIERAVPPDAPLSRGSRYRWRVEAEHAGETLRSTTVDFRVLSESEMRQLDEARSRYGNIPFLLGPQYERLGLNEEASWEYLKLTQANPASPQAHRALENVQLRAQRHRTRGL